MEDNKCKSRPAQDWVVKVNLWKATNEHNAAIFYDLEVENSKWKIAYRTNYKILFFEVFSGEFISKHIGNAENK